MSLIRLPVWLAGLVVIAGLAASTANAQAVNEVDLQLVLAADVSGSMSPDELLMQREGYIAAFRHPDLVRAISSGPLGRVAVTYVEWAGSNQQSIVVPWMVLGGLQSAERFAGQLAAASTSGRGSRTAVSSALLFASVQFGLSGVRSVRRTIDISGDGIGDDGPPIWLARDQVVAQGIAVNGLSIAPPDAGDDDVHSYYKDHVVGGPGSFAIVVASFKDFAPAVRRKLVSEIAGREPASELSSMMQ